MDPLVTWACDHHPGGPPPRTTMCLTPVCLSIDQVCAVVLILPYELLHATTLTDSVHRLKASKYILISSQNIASFRFFQSQNFNFDQQ
jgi:hypothetical protein